MRGEYPGEDGQWRYDTLTAITESEPLKKSTFFSRLCEVRNLQGNGVKESRNKTARKVSNTKLSAFVGATSHLGRNITTVGA